MQRNIQHHKKSITQTQHQPDCFTLNTNTRNQNFINFWNSGLKYFGLLQPEIL